MLRVGLLAAFLCLASAYPSKEQCPKIEEAKIEKLDALMGTWFRTFRSQFSKEEPPFKCLSSDFFGLNGKDFKVTDFNYHAM